VDGSWSYSI